MKKSKKTNQKQRKAYFRLLKKLMKPRYKKPTFVYLGEKITNGGVILSNHEGTDAPLSLEMYLDAPIRMWGAGEMNSKLGELYRYQTNIYYHQKKHWNIHLARLFCLIASPLTYLFYSGLDLISTHHDVRFVKTIRESINSINDGDNIVIFPEISDNGYLPVLEGFHEGFVTFASICLRKGIDLPIFVTYFQREKLIYVVDAPVMFSELVKNGETGRQVADKLCQRCNELGAMTFTDEELEASKSNRADKKEAKIS